MSKIQTIADHQFDGYQIWWTLKPLNLKRGFLISSAESSEPSDDDSYFYDSDEQSDGPTGYSYGFRRWNFAQWSDDESDGSSGSGGSWQEAP